MTTCEAFLRSPAHTDWGERLQRCEAAKGLRYYFDRHGVAHAFCPAVGHFQSVLRRHAPDQERPDAIEHERHADDGRDHTGTCPHCARLAELQQQSWYAL